MLKGSKYRLYPTPEQVILLEKHFGCTRLLYNLALETKSYAYSSQGKRLSVFDLKKEITGLKKDFEWLKEINSQSLQQSIINLDTAYQNFFNNRTAFPNFKGKYDKQSFAVPQKFFIEEGKLSIPKFREGIEIEIHRPIKGAMKSVAISKTTTGKYFASILCDTGNVITPKKPIIESTAIGIDLGLKSFISLSDGTKYDNPRYFHVSQEKLAWKQRKLARKKDGSNRRKKARLRVAEQYEKTANQRKDFLHKLSRELVNNHDTLCFEDLKISNMVKNRKLALSISDAGWGMFVQFCKYKAEWDGKNILQIGSFEPSTKECHVCGHLNHDLTLKDREWDCAGCGAHHDRDLNATKVIKNKCLRRAERSHQDAEVSPLPQSRKRIWRKRTVEASKVQGNMMDFLS